MRCLPLLGLLSVSPAFAEPILTLDRTLAHIDGSAWENPDADDGEFLRLFGHVTEVHGILAPLAAELQPGVELTYSFMEASYENNGIADTFEDCAWIFDEYAGSLRVFVDDTPDAARCPLTYEDGELVLDIALDSYRIMDGNGVVGWYDIPCDRVEGSLRVVGGSWHDALSAGEEWVGVIQGGLYREPYEFGGWVWCLPLGPPAGFQLDPFFWVDGVVDVALPIPTETTSWSRLKSEFR